MMGTARCIKSCWDKGRNCDGRAGIKIYPCQLSEYEVEVALTFSREEPSTQDLSCGV